jgi:hypothetical protein
MASTIRRTHKADDCVKVLGQCGMTYVFCQQLKMLRLPSTIVANGIAVF